MDEDEYSSVTYDLTLAAAQTLARLNPRMTFCYVTGTGTDSSEQGSVDVGARQGRDRERAAAAVLQGRLHVPALR